jgi:hypothetical protein
MGRALPGAPSSWVRTNVAEILAHVIFELRAIDRMDLNADVPSRQTFAGFVYVVKTHLGPESRRR